MILTTLTNIITTAKSTNPKEKAFPNTVSGPTQVTSGVEVEYAVTSYGTNKDFIHDRGNINWAIWINHPMLSGGSDYIKIKRNSVTQIADSSTDIFDENDKNILKQLLEDVCLKAEVYVDDSNVPKLKIVFSKWLDGMTVQVEAFRNKADKHASTVSSVTAAQKELLDMYWVSGLRSEISGSGYNSSIKLAIKTLGFSNGESIPVSLYGKLDSGNQLVQWGGNDINNIAITNRYTYTPYTVPQKADANITSVQDADGNANLVVKVNGSIPGMTSPTDEFAQLKLSGDAYIVNAFFANELETPEDDTQVKKYEKVTNVYPGQEVYLVAETIGLDNTEIQFQLFENSTIIVANGTPLSVLQNNLSVDVVKATTKDGIAKIKVKFQEINSVTYNAWNTALMPGNDQYLSSTIHLQVNVKDSANVIMFNNTVTIDAPHVVQKVYHDGYLSQTNYVQSLVRKVTLKYIKANNTEYSIGTFDIHWAQKWSRDSSSKNGSIVKSGKTYYYEGKKGEILTPLITFWPTSGVHEYTFTIDSVEHKFSENTNREYFNPERIGAVFGAIINTGYNDVVSNGSVEKQGTGAPSVSHINGNNMDFKYLRTDKKRAFIDKKNDGSFYQPLVSSDEILDQSRQNNFLDELFKYGFGKLILNLSHKIHPISENKTFNHCQIFEDHEDHLHIQGFQPKYK